MKVLALGGAGAVCNHAIRDLVEFSDFDEIVIGDFNVNAAMAEPISCAVNTTENCGIKKGDTVVVVGAGPLGIMNCMVARSLGASKVILAQRDGKRFEMAKQFPTDRLVNPTTEDLVQVIKDETNGVGADCAIIAAPLAEHVRKAVVILADPEFPAGKLANPIIPLEDVLQGYEIMRQRECMRVVLQP